MSNPQDINLKELEDKHDKDFDMEDCDECDNIAIDCEQCKGLGKQWTFKDYKVKQFLSDKLNRIEKQLKALFCFFYYLC